MAPRALTPAGLAFATMFGLRPAEAEILARLYDSGPIIALRAHVCAIRRALEAEAIDTQHGKYRLTEQGRLECQSALAQFRGWINEEAA